MLKFTKKANLYMSQRSEHEIIKAVVYEFYQKATVDVLIGYQFRKIQEFDLAEFKNHPLRPPIEAFAHHLPIINEFWIRQLSGQSIDSAIQLNVINKHLYLNLKTGELNRFKVLFEDTIKQYQSDLEMFGLYEKWFSKLDHFATVFSRSKLFKKKSEN